MNDLRMVIAAIVLGALIGAGTVLAISQKPAPRKVAVAPEVCEHNGSVVSALQSGSVITVRCSSGMIELVAAK